jgi:hypothetical protein
MGSEIIFLVEKAGEGGYTARALGHSIFTEADTWEDMKLPDKPAATCVSQHNEAESITLPFHATSLCELAL